MDIELAKNGTASTAGALVVNSFRQCEGGVVFVDSATLPGGTTSTTAPLNISVVDGQTQPTRDGGSSTVIRVRVKMPISYYNTNGTIINSVPEIVAHTVLKVPRLIANALSGTLTNDVDDTHGGATAQQTATRAVVRALAYLSTIVTGQPIDVTALEAAMRSNPLFLGAIGVCPLDYLAGDYGTTRVVPPPARS